MSNVIKFTAQDIDRYKKPDDFWRILAFIRAKVGFLFKRDDPGAAVERISTAYALAYKFALQYEGDLERILTEYPTVPSATTDVLTLLANIPVMHQVKDGSPITHLNCGYYVHGSNHRVHVSPKFEPLESLSNSPDFSKNTIGEEQLGAITAAHQEYLTNAHYNSLQHFLDFVQYVYQARFKNPNATIEELYCLYNKEHSTLPTIKQTQAAGTCIDHAIGLALTYQQLGFTAHILPTTEPNGLMTRSDVQLNEHGEKYVRGRIYDLELLNRMEFTHTGVVLYGEATDELRKTFHPALQQYKHIAIHCETGVGSDVEPAVYVYKDGYFYLSSAEAYSWGAFQYERLKRTPKQVAIYCLDDIRLGQHCSPEDGWKLRNRSLRAHEVLQMHPKVIENFGKSRNYLTINLREGMLRIVTEDMAIITEFYVPNDAINYELIHDAQPFYTSVVGSRNKTKRREADLYQVSFDLDWFSKNLDQPVRVCKKNAEAVTVAALDAARVFFEDVARIFELDQNFADSMLLVIKRIRVYRSLLL